MKKQLTTAMLPCRENKVPFSYNISNTKLLGNHSRNLCNSFTAKNFKHQQHTVYEILGFCNDSGFLGYGIMWSWRWLLAFWKNIFTSTLKTEAVYSSKTLVNIYKSSWHHSPKHQNPKDTFFSFPKKKKLILTFQVANFHGILSIFMGKCILPF
jgi:hypothetical protein